MNERFPRWLVLVIAAIIAFALMGLVVVDMAQGAPKCCTKTDPKTGKCVRWDLCEVRR